MIREKVIVGTSDITIKQGHISQVSVNLQVSRIFGRSMFRVNIILDNDCVVKENLILVRQITVLDNRGKNRFCE